MFINHIPDQQIYLEHSYSICKYATVCVQDMKMSSSYSSIHSIYCCLLMLFSAIRKGKSQSVIFYSVKTTAEYLSVRLLEHMCVYNKLHISSHVCQDVIFRLFGDKMLCRPTGDDWNNVVCQPCHNSRAALDRFTLPFTHRLIE